MGATVRAKAPSVVCASALACASRAAVASLTCTGCTPAVALMRHTSLSSSYKEKRCSHSPRVSAARASASSAPRPYACCVTSVLIKKSVRLTGSLGAQPARPAHRAAAHAAAAKRRKGVP